MLKDPRRTALLVVLIVLVLLLLVWTGFDWQPRIEVGLPVVVLVLLLLGIVGYVTWTFRERTAELPPDRRATPPASVAAIDQLVDRYGEGPLSVEQAATFIACINEPKTRFARVSESAELLTRSVKIRTSMLVDLSSASSSEDAQVIPIYLPQKPRSRHLVVDGLRVSVQGTRVSTLDSSRTSAFAAAVVRALVYAHDPAVLSRYIEHGEDAVWAVLASTIAATTEQTSSADEALTSIAGPRGVTPMLDAARNLVSTIAANHPVCAVLSADEMQNLKWPHLVRIEFERRVLPRVSDTVRTRSALGLARLETIVKVALGVPPRYMNLQLEQFGRTDSLHVELVGPAGTYVSAVNFRITRVAQPTSATVIERPLVGQRRAHVQLADCTGGPVVCVGEFSERSPGSFATAAVISLGSFLVVGLLALNHGTTAETGKLLPALLALPIGIAALANVQAAQLSRRPELLSRFLTGAVVIMNIAAFALAVTATGVDPAVRDRMLVLLACASGVVSAATVISWILRVATESHFRRRDPDEE